VYKIGEFSKITFLTVKTLRYYDEQDILKPSYRNEENGYRFYNESDFDKAKLVQLLRSLEFSIAEIKDVLSNYKSSSDLSYFLEEKKMMIEAKIKEEKKLLSKINLLIKPTGMEENGMNYKVTVKHIESVKVATIRYKGKYSDMGKYVGKIYRALKGNAKDEPFNLYYDDEYKEEADIEVCVPTSKTIEHAEITVKELPKIKAICTTHIGSYDKINEAYKALMDYAEENNLQMGIPSREIYKKGPGMIFKGNPKNYVTEIVIPIV
jgi:DNA-binding transcriptional MerR regulator